MTCEICIPRLGSVKSDATLIEWAVGEGAKIACGEMVLNIETEKINYEIRAESSGLLHILVTAGTTCAVGTVVGLIAASQEELSQLQDQPAAKAPAASTPEVTPTERIRISPIARKIAQEHQVDITTITGSGPRGRIVRDDIEKAIGARPATHLPARAEAPGAEQKKIRYTIALKGKRAVISRNMQASLAQSAQVSALGEIDMTELIKHRQTFIEREESVGSRITYNDMILFIVAKVLKEKDIFNSSLIGNEIKVWDDINIGVVVALEDGLIVPVIKNADAKSMAEISKASKALIEKAKRGLLELDDISGGTFTITNLGSAGAGWRFETSIINPPESAILGIGGISDRAVVKDGQIMIRPIMTYSFTYDHRVIDGARAVQFMSRVIELMETPFKAGDDKND